MFAITCIQKEYKAFLEYASSLIILYCYHYLCTHYKNKQNPKPEVSYNKTNYIHMIRNHMLTTNIRPIKSKNQRE